MSLQHQSQQTRPLRFAIVAAEEYRERVDALVRAAVGTFMARDVAEHQLRMMWGPSLFTLPLLVRSLVQGKACDGVLVVACAVRDGADRYYFEMAEVHRALMDVMMDSGVPVVPVVVAADKVADLKTATGAAGDGNPGAQGAARLLRLLTA